jgi:hypothetical protein
MQPTGIRRALLLALVTVLVGACSDGTPAGAPANAPAAPAAAAAVDAEPGEVVGTTLDTQGRPLARSVIWIRPAITTGLVRTKTDAEGRYKAGPLLELPYYAYAWAPIEYQGKHYCLRLGMPNEADYDTFSGREAVVRDFRWQLTGKIGDTTFGPDEDGHYFGGTVLLMLSFENGDSYRDKVELTLTPTAPLADGSTGETLVRTVDLTGSHFVLDIPLGVYEVQAVLIDAQGQRKPVLVGPGYDKVAERTRLEFPASSSGCGGGDYGSGLSRAYIYVSDQPPTG